MHATRAAAGGWCWLMGRVIWTKNKSRDDGNPKSRVLPTRKKRDAHGVGSG
jgi:hypothetical protein